MTLTPRPHVCTSSVPTLGKKKKTERTSVPKLWAAVHQVKDLSRVQELLELAEELHSLVVSAFGVAQDQQRTAAGSRGGLPEA